MPSLLPRVLEPEVAASDEEAADYDAMEHTSVNRAFCEDLLRARSPLPSPILDVGTGTARIPIELCSRAPSVEIVAVDLDEPMLALARRNVDEARLSARIRIERVDAKALPYPDGAFATTVSNSIVHHIPDPRDVLAEMWRVTARGGLLFVRDLVRPKSASELAELVALHAGEPPAEAGARASHLRQRELLRASLHAALTLEELEKTLEEVGIAPRSLTKSSDRHWTLSCVKP